MALFFVSCPLGFEKDLVVEMKNFWFEMMDLDGLPTKTAFPEVEIIQGGIQLEAPEHLGYQINFFTKIASRVLIRILNFQARYFDQFEKEIKKLDLEKWLIPQEIHVKIESHKSRLNNEKNLEESLTSVLKIKKYKVVSKKNDDESKRILTPTLYIRIEKDYVVVSLDTSGEHLHRRGYAVYRGEAPIRETLAAYLIEQMNLLLEKKIATNQTVTLIDPFVGSGTLLFEAASNKSALLTRDFAWSHFLNKPKIFKSESWQKNLRWLKTLDEKKYNLIGIDQDPKSQINIKKNLEIFNQLFNSQLFIQTVTADSMKVDIAAFEALPNKWVITNPPYGHRLSEGDAKEILERFEKELSLQGLVVLHPESWHFKFRSLKLGSQLDFKNQGLKLKLSVYSN